MAHEENKHLTWQEVATAMKQVSNKLSAREKIYNVDKLIQVFFREKINRDLVGTTQVNKNIFFYN